MVKMDTPYMKASTGGNNLKAENASFFNLDFGENRVGKTLGQSPSVKKNRHPTSPTAQAGPKRDRPTPEEAVKDQRVGNVGPGLLQAEDLALVEKAQNEIPFVSPRHLAQ